MDKRHWVVYLIRCSDESLYCGITNNLKKRLATHNSGRAAKYTRFRRPVELVGASPEMTKSDALKLEYQVKQVPATKKIFELKKGEAKMKMNLKKDLQAVNKELNTLSKKIEKMIVAVDKLEKPKAAPAKPAKKVAVKKPASKKSVGEVTAVDTVLGIIKRSKKGIDTAALMEKTGYNQKKVANIVFKLRKQGKIKNEGKGVYLKA
ncbi:MAG: GIY-YIG nuclease family protein [Deltaproteobacteria bacterium]|nr:GIY-YIG nuclease family protein [Deltaproteobacteria bacterium]MBW2538696.1 GIY-YIG nuclease family protein [Deltaproteobacteria bacterium]